MILSRLDKLIGIQTEQILLIFVWFQSLLKDQYEGAEQVLTIYKQLWQIEIERKGLNKMVLVVRLSY